METVLEAVRRDRFGRNEAGRIRREGRIPAVLYGGSEGKAEPVAVNPKELMRILYSDSGVNTLISLKLDGQGDTRVLVREYQLDPVTQSLLHADFYRVAMDKLLEVKVPIHLTGEAKGIKAQGAIVDFVSRDIVIECLPGDIPENITVDVTELMLHDAIRVRDLPDNPKWKAVSEPDTLIVHLVALKVEEEPAPADAAVAAVAVPAAPAEPEVIKKGKVEKPEEEKE